MTFTLSHGGAYLGKNMREAYVKGLGLLVAEKGPSYAGQEADSSHHLYMHIDTLRVVMLTLAGGEKEKIAELPLISRYCADLFMSVHPQLQKTKLKSAIKTAFKHNVAAYIKYLVNKF